MKKLLTLFLIGVLLLPVFCSCNRDSDSSSDPIALDGFSFVIVPNDTVFTAKQINSIPDGDNITVFTRDYTVNGTPAFTLDFETEGRTALSVRLSYTDSFGYEFDIVEMSENHSEITIPVNGFAVSIPNGLLDGLRVNVGQIVEVEGYFDAVPTFEQVVLANLSPVGKGSIAFRRISLVDPVSDVSGDKIVFLSAERDADVSYPENSVVAILEQTTSTGYSVVSVGGTELLDVAKAAFVFCGAYNIAYASKYVLAGEKFMVNNLDAANSLTDQSAIVIGDTCFEIPDSHKNSDTLFEDGVYVYDGNFDGVVTPGCDSARIDITLVDDIVVTISEPGGRSFIPSANGFTFVFVGEDNVAAAETLGVGDTPELLLISKVELPDRFVRIGDTVIEVSLIDGYRQPEGVAVVYTPAFGATTGTNSYGVEIAIKDDKVIEVELSTGDMEIPEGGYVLSVHKDHPEYRDACLVSEGESVTISLANNDFSVTTLEYNAVNAVRGENMLVIYANRASTGTNVYGYEIVVDADGKMESDSYSGNAIIPAGGFVLSGHGTSKEALEELYIKGATVLFDEDDKTITIIKKPDLNIVSAESELAAAIESFDAAKDALLNIDYDLYDERVAIAADMLAEAKQAFNEYDYSRAIALALSVRETASHISYAIIDSHYAENRAVWYRASETSDDQVRATVEKMVSLNVNAIYIETWYNGTCIGLIDVENVTHTPVHGDYDALEAFVRICHEYGIEVHAWVENFFAGTFDGNHTPSNPIITEWSDKLLLDSMGNDYYFYQDNHWFAFLNPYDRDCRDLVLEVYRQLIENYDIDGLHLDYIRFPELNYQLYDYGYNADIIAAFAKETGYKSDPHNFVSGTKEHTAWVKFRQDIITSFVEEVYDLVNELEPDLWLSAATYPDVPNVVNTIFQDVRAWVNNGWMDEVHSMSYGADNVYVSNNAAMYVDICKGKAFYSTGIQAFGETAKLNFAHQLTEVIGVGADGVSIFSLGSITPDTYQYEITEGAFRTPSVQVYRWSETVAAQLSYLLDRIDNTASLVTLLDKSAYDAFVSKANELIEEANGVDVDTAANAVLTQYAKDTIAALADLDALLKTAYGDDNKYSSDIDRLVYWLNLSLYRINN